MSDPTSVPVVIGWGAIVLPKKGRIRELPITENDRARAKEIDQVVNLAMASYRGSGIERMGVLSSLLVEFAEKPDAASAVGAAATLISDGLGHPYWWVEASQERGGMSTSVHRLEATSVEEAMAEFRRQPTVRMILMMTEVLDLARDHRDPGSPPPRKPTRPPPRKG